MPLDERLPVNTVDPGEARSEASRQFADLRWNTVQAWLLISWVAAAGLVYQLVLASSIDTEIWIPAAAAVGCLAILTVVPWRRIQRGVLGSGLVLLWSAAITAGLFSSSMLWGRHMAIGFAVIVMLGTVMLIGPGPMLIVALMAVGGFSLTFWRTGGDLDQVDFAFELGVLAVICGAAFLLSKTLVRYIHNTQLHVDGFQDQELALQARQRDLERVYEVSRTIGAGRSLAEVLPELVGRVTASLGAKVGLVALYKPGEQALEVISPIWVAGHALRAEGYRLPLTDAGLVQKVFVSGEGGFVNELANGTRDRLLTDLDASQVAAVPLRLESQTIGVLLVTDRENGDFDADDLELLTSLAAPAALILEHMTRFEEAQETSQKMAEVAQLKTDFVSVVSHELRTPLTSIIGSLATLSRPQLAPVDPGARELLASATRQADRLKRLIEDLLTVSRLDNRSMPMRPEAIELQSYIREIVRAVPGAEGVVSLDLAPELPLIQADPEHLRRIVTNLVENGLKYAQGGPLEVIARVSGKEVHFSVVDHGPGIPYELSDHIFERFTQVSAHETRTKGGTGLGLSIVRGLSQAMGGRVWYEPTVGGGATFVVALPVNAPAVRLPTPETV